MTANGGPFSFMNELTSHGHYMGFFFFFFSINYFSLGKL